MLTFKSTCYIQPVKLAAPTHCTICETPLQGAYCHACGQKHTGKEAGFLELLQEALGTFFSLERSGAASIWALIRHPQKVVMNYIDGNRGYWQSPNKLIFYALVVYGLHVLWGDKEVLNMSFDVEGVNPAWFFLALVLPLLVLSGWLMYGPRKIKLSHHLVSSSYFLAVWFVLLTLLGDLVDWVMVRDWPMMDFLFFLILVSWSQARVFKPQWKAWKQLLMAQLQVVLFFALVALLVAVIYLGGGRVKTSPSNSAEIQQESL